MTEVVIKTSGLTKIFGDGAPVHAVREVDLTVHRGEFVALVGPSGSGKTTLLNLLSGIDTPTRGAVYFRDTRLDTLTESERARLRLHHMGFVFQSYNLIPVLTAYENVALVLELLGVPARERHARVMALFEELGLAELADRFPTKLSGGQQQRVAVARAMIHEPALILADEPTANLDTENAMALMELIARLNRTRGVTVILTTHDPRIMKWARRIIELRDGRVIDDRTVTPEPAVQARSE